MSNKLNFRDTKKKSNPKLNFYRHYSRRWSDEI